ncbi:glycerate kinase [Sulfitobacter mediterraneus]|uniref:glycerate kinase type-2 family protein n=1 Tax=Sulfitobacter mediterraneus TaxID=83219 RepID=UPI00193A137F|nr:glycerate kinase [Sulfitobacter mediterraneus]MBM1556273.1 glycerate kinase [Sulfitobacter mediterraneus]MBM1567689.1 glycerate kinase [Sulfitobacter mediterraneus]MBM1571627.1 glycerate kinase [Sulfitobacter mediterraneus]MBM1575415.1 glycerate kinase [Sulfitobacter mediterraneus]MBM1579094.1 glycerate kinase [Sulfitobacter mediterraneus]
MTTPVPDLSANDRALLVELFGAAVGAADPLTALQNALPDPPQGRTVVVGAGKGAAQLANALEQLWPGPLTGVVATRYGFGVPCKQITVMEAAHPVPNQAGLDAAAALLKAVSGLGPEDLVIALICGGGSALLPAPPEGLSLQDEQELNQALLRSGAPISAMNAIRKHVSAIKGGRLAAAAYPARVVSLVVSDVPGDDPAQVASGPTVPDTVTRQDALAMIDHYNIDMPDHIRAHITSQEANAPHPDDPVFASNSVRVIASARQSLDAAAAMAKAHGLDAVILSDAIEGEAREVAQMHAAIARQVKDRDHPFGKPVVILSGGETTVTLRHKGRGGRNTEFLLSLALHLEGAAGITALAADTDGIDGSEDNAGAFVDAASCQRMRAHGRDPRADLNANDAFSAFEACDDLFSPGPTGTNVNDFRAIIVR